jgi:hypothetical protein
MSARANAAFAFHNMGARMRSPTAAWLRREFCREPTEARDPAGYGSLPQGRYRKPLREGQGASCRVLPGNSRMPTYFVSRFHRCAPPKLGAVRKEHHPLADEYFPVNRSVRYRLHCKIGWYGVAFQMEVQQIECFRVDPKRSNSNRKVGRPSTKGTVFREVSPKTGAVPNHRGRIPGLEGGVLIHAKRSAPAMCASSACTRSSAMESTQT